MCHPHPDEVHHRVKVQAYDKFYTSLICNDWSHLINLDNTKELDNVIQC